MSTIKLKTKNDLENFLKILAEESVLAAMQKPAREPEEKRQSSFVKKIKQDKMALSEEDPEPSAPDKQEPASPPPETPPEEKSPPPEKDSDKVADLNPSISDVVDAIKDIRGGMGASDSAIENELRTYFGRLESAEQVALVVMLRSIGEIMRKMTNGTDAREPADMNIFTTMKPKETTAASQEPESSSSEKQAPTEPENTAPPIKVGEPVSETYRAKIRNLLRSNQR